MPARGYFAHALVDPQSCFRVALKARPPRLASLVLTSEAPLRRALAQMDHGGPFPEGHRPLRERQYGLQRVGLASGYGEDERERLMDLQPLPELRRLMCSQDLVLVLEVYCALAPKESANDLKLEKFSGNTGVKWLEVDVQRAFLLAFCCVLGRGACGTPRSW